MTKKISPAKCVLLSTVFIPTLFIPALAWAQSAQQQAQAQGGLEEIFVTAQKRSQSIQDVAASITAISGDTLTAAGIQDTQMLGAMTPNLLVQRSVVGKIHIRGIGNENYTIGGDPSTAVHTDGVYVSRAAAGLFDLFDVNRVEVLRGPQGTLYGRNATAGVINVVPNYPTAEAGGYATAEYGNYDKVRVEAAAGGPLGDSGLMGRVAVLGGFRDGYTENINAAAAARGFGELDDQDLMAGRAQLAYESDNPFTARIAVEYLHDDSNLPAYRYLRQPPFPAVAPNPPGLRTVNQGFELGLPTLLPTPNTRSFGTDDDIFKSYQFGTGLHLGYDAGAFTIKSITGYRDTKFNWLNDGDGVATFYINYGQQDDSEQWSQELQIASDPADKVSWLLGGFLFHEKGNSFIALPIRLSVLGVGLPDDSIIIDGSAKTSAEAAFGELYFQATDQLKITIGGRYSHEKRVSDYKYDALFAAPVRQGGRLSSNNFSPKFVVSYQADEDMNLYASVTRGFKSGGFNLLAIQPSFRSEKIWSYEAGVKSTLADGRVRFNTSVFFSDFKDLQVGQIVNLQSVLTNAAAAELYGIESELTAKASDQVDLGASLAYLHADFTAFCTGDPTRPTAAVQAGCTATAPINLKGFTLPRAPRFSLGGYADFTQPLDGGSAVNARVDVRYTSRTYFTQFNRPTVSQEGYAVANARLTWIAPSEQFSIGAYVNNIFDKDYFTEVLESGAFNPQLVEQGYVAPPRTYGVKVGVTF
jgi:iron complex outermembrane receptor protein